MALLILFFSNGLGPLQVTQAKIDSQDENLKSSSLKPEAIFGMQHHLVDLYQVCSNFTHVAKIGPSWGHIL